MQVIVIVDYHAVPATCWWLWQNLYEIHAHSFVNSDSWAFTVTAEALLELEKHLQAERYRYTVCEEDTDRDYEPPGDHHQGSESSSGLPR